MNSLEEKLVFINQVSGPLCPHIPWWMHPILWLFGDEFSATEAGLTVNGYHWRGSVYITHLNNGERV